MHQVPARDSCEAVFLSQTQGNPTMAQTNEDTNISFDPSLLTAVQKHTLTDKIHEKTLYGNGEACDIWRASVNSSGYPQMKLGKDIEQITGCHRPINPACLLYSIENSFVLLKHTDIRLSHLCHQKKCVKLSHIIMEPLATNSQRQFCAQSKVCTGHTVYPNCKF